MFAKRLQRLPRPTGSGPLALYVPVVSALVIGGCGKVCSDDGFAWQQDPQCVAQLSATETATEATDASESASEPTETAPTGGSGGGTYCVDADGDGFGDPGQCTDVPEGETPPDGTVPNDDDCDDTSADTFPGAAENEDPDACMKDADGDGWGDSDVPGGGGVMPGTDCDDTSDDTFPGAAPNDSMTACMKDADGDDWGDDDPPGGGGVMPGTDCDDADMSAFDMCSTCIDRDDDGWVTGCDDFPPGFPAEDCDDTDPNTFPGAAPNDDPDACMTDMDGDDWGDATPTDPDTVPGTDCDDLSGNTFPGAAELDDPDACMQDKDDDGHGDANPDNPEVQAGNDCNDDQELINPTDSALITAPITSGDISEIDVENGTLTPIASLDIAGFNPWIPTSLAINPIDLTVVAALAFNNTLVTMNYCGGGAPTPLPLPHKKSLCGIGFDAAGVLYGIDGQVDQLVKFKPDGSIETVTPLTFEGKTLNVAECGMTWDCHEQRLLVSDSGSGGIYTVNTADGTTTRLADVPDKMFGGGLAYDPVSKAALSCLDTSLFRISLDGTNDFTQLTELSAPADDLEFAMACR